MKKILGLDLGTNSIGWAVVNADEIYREDGSTYLKPNGISAAGSRIIPMSADVLGKFESGTTVSQTKDRTEMRMARRLHERVLLRRERLLRVLNLMGFLPEHFANKITRYGKFTDDSEPKLAWRKNAEGKYEFVFQEAFNEMLEDFKKNQPELVSVDENGKLRKVPYDWTIYYLRKKALEKALSKEELSWLLLQFNQKRGYYQLRGEEEDESQNKLVEYIAQKVVKVEAPDQKKGNDTWYKIYLENGMICPKASRVPLDWVGKVKEFIVTTELENDGSLKKNKEGEIKRSFRIPQEDDWTLLKKKTEFDIDASKKTVGCYIYDSLLNNPKQKIIGKLVRTVERKFYKEELAKILRKQVEFIPEFQDENLYKKCIEELYPINEAHRNNIAKPDFVNFFINDILFYQRPLKSKKSQIDNCPYESHIYIYKNQEKNIEEKRIAPVKCIAKSNPLFQEFRLWQFVQNLRIYQREKEVDGKLWTDVDVTNEFLKSEDDYVKLFDWLNDRGAIDQDTLLKSFFKVKKEKNKDQYPYRWKYVEDKEYPCNETRASILAGFSKCKIDSSILTREIEESLWHILYSVEDKIEITKALKKIAEKYRFDDAFVNVFSKIKPFDKEYGSYSEKAIKKLLPLMRMGKYWNQNNIDTNTLDRIDKIINGEYDEKISNRVRDNAVNLKGLNQFRGLPVWLACYIVYNRHSEAKDCAKWEKPADIDEYLKSFKQHSLRNPIVEQVVTETLRTVRDIWKQEGQIDEIHLELGRDLKNPADKRKKMSENIIKNENANLRIKAMLMEFKNPDMGIENVRPHSPSQQDILRIYEEYALNSNEKYDDSKGEFVPDTDEIPDYVTKVVSGLGSLDKKKQPSKKEIEKYKCWLEQRYRSPYTGKMIPLAKLFTTAYEVEHIIPQSRYFDDSFSNKVICEAEVNKLKDCQLGREFINNHHGEKVQLSQGEVVEIFSTEAYEKFIKEHYANNYAKKQKLLMEEIPDDFINRQLNDSRYISKIVKGLLSNIVREKIDDENHEQEATSKNLITCNGTVTDRLKKDWGMNDVWNNIILPRFIRMNEITHKDCFTTTNTEGHLIPQMPLDLQKGFNKKRIDHRHHAMDAIVIACTTKAHVQYLSNENAKVSNYKLQKGLANLLCSFKEVEYKKKRKDANGIWIDSDEKVKRNVPDKFLKPWDSFTTDAKTALENIIVSFKQNLRVINKATNHYESYKDESGLLRIGNDGKPEKKLTQQVKGDSWAIRKSMHKKTFYGEVNLQFTKFVALTTALKIPQCIVDRKIRENIIELQKAGFNFKAIKDNIEKHKDAWGNINPSSIEIYYYTKDTNDRYFATRFCNDLVSIFNKVSNEEKALDIIKKVTDSGIRKILKAHLRAKNNNPEVAFSADGIDEMNRNIVLLNDGKFHQPIYKVRIYEKANKFCVGQKGSKRKKFVEADDGTQLFFAIFENENKKRSYLTIPLNVMIECQKKYHNQWMNNIELYLKETKTIEDNLKLQFILSPNDLVYLPTDNEIENGIKAIDKKRIYKFIDPNSNKGNFVPYTIAKVLFSINFTKQKELNLDYPIQDELGVGSQCSKNYRALTGEMIKETCVPIKVDRLGNIKELDGRRL